MAQHDLSAKGRRALASKGIARPDGSYPISDAEDVRKAVDDWNRTGQSGAVKAWIIKRARAVGAEIPAALNPSGPTDEVATAKTMTNRKG